MYLKLDGDFNYLIEKHSMFILFFKCRKAKYWPFTLHLSIIKLGVLIFWDIFQPIFLPPNP